MASVTSPLGPYFGDAGDLLPGGALWFLDPSTDLPKTIYTSDALTIPLQNPMPLDSASCTEDQVFYGEGTYKVRLYRLVDETMVAPVFPTDYAIVREWLDDGVEVPAVVPVSMYTVGTIAELSALDPADVDDVVTVLGYYASTDAIEPRSYYWSPASTASNDGGSVIPASGYATGRWLLKCLSPVVDVRWFGAFPGMAVDCNSAFTSAAAYSFSSGAVGSSKTTYFPAGAYQVATGSLTLTGPCKMSLGVTFLNRLATDYEIRINGRFEINALAQLQNASSVGTITPTFASNVSGAANGDTVNEVWWAGGLEEAIPLCGSCPLLVTRVQSVAPLGAAYEVSKLIVRGSGDVEFQASANNVVIAELDAPQGNIVISTTGGEVNPGVAFGGRVYASTVAANIVMYALGSAADLIVDTDVGLVLSCSPRWGCIRAAGGALITLATKTTTVGNVIGPVHSCLGTVLGNADVSTFFLRDADEVVGFVRSAMAVNGQADFAGNAVSLDVDLSEFANVLIEDGSFSGDIAFNDAAPNQLVQFKRCTITGGTTGDNVGLVLTDCVWQQVGVTETFQAGISARDCTLTFVGDIAGSDLTLIDCNTILAHGKTMDFANIRIDGGTFYGDTAAGCTINSGVSYWGSDTSYVNVTLTPEPDWDIFLHDNRMANSFVVFSGSGTMENIDIKNNNFVNSASLALYEPLNIDAMTVTSSAGSCVVSGNVPANSNTVLKTTGIALRQTEFKVAVAGGTGVLNRSLNTEDQNYAFAPWRVDGLGFQFGIHVTSAGVAGVMGMIDLGGGDIGYQITRPADESFVQIKIYP